MAGEYDSPLPHNAEAVLATPELLENVVLQLPAKKILTTALRVSTHWKQLIIDSPQIQRKLFFLPLDQDVADSDVSVDTGITTPLYHNSFGLNPALECVQVPDASEIHDWPSGLLWGYTCDRRTKTYAATDKTRLVCLRRAILPTPPPSESRWLGQEASWRNMFITQPPCALVKVFIAGNASDVEDGEAVHFMIQDLDGIKLGVLEDLVQASAADLTIPGTANSGEQFDLASVYFELITSSESEPVFTRMLKDIGEGSPWYRMACQAQARATMFGRSVRPGA